MTAEENYLKYFDDEAYLLDEVAPSFRETGHIDPADFYMMLIWKANRSKNRHRERLKQLSSTYHGNGTFADAVERICGSLWNSRDDKERLKVLMTEWEFYTPTATAILSLLYPDRFTVYDWRVKDQVGLERDLAQRSFSDAFWEEYQTFIAVVRGGCPSRTPPRSSCVRSLLEWQILPRGRPPGLRFVTYQ